MNFRARADVGGCRQRDARHARKMLCKHIQAQVVLPEIVAPLRYAVRFVDGEQRDTGFLQQCQGLVLQEAFGCQIQ